VWCRKDGAHGWNHEPRYSRPLATSESMSSSNPYSTGVMNHMSTSSGVEAIYEASDDRPQSERALDAHRASVQHLDPRDVLMVACDILREQDDEDLLDLIRELKREGYPAPDTTSHPGVAQRITRAFRRAAQEAMDCLAQQHVCGGGR
jgi:hypothetical protein